jgi:hypothetical protein
MKSMSDKQINEKKNLEAVKVGIKYKKAYLANDILVSRINRMIKIAAIHI